MKFDVITIGTATMDVFLTSRFFKVLKDRKHLEKIGFFVGEAQCFALGSKMEIDKPKTKVFAAQAQGCSPIVTAIKEKSDIIKPVKPKTIAKSLAIGNPADGYYAIETVRETGGWGEASSDEEIVDAIKLLARTEGIFTETAGGVTVAATIKLIEQGFIPKDESIVISITGNGLKTQEAVQHHIGKPIKIKPTLKAFEEKFGEFFFDLHIRDCRIVDVDENKTQEWCNKQKEDLIVELVNFIIQIRQEGYEAGLNLRKRSENKL